ncbi:hypothetical protein LENED_003088 [Lentinula edodes]|uniref:Uncharacterized protein n=1 Tax=Lentinula edodes TaxID=5353 RepID=A0A1Q3E2K2_LENED|nr:hypothetical protein LENED_003088 [Lentinula edodes]
MSGLLLNNMFPLSLSSLYDSMLLIFIPIFIFFVFTFPATHTFDHRIHLITEHFRILDCPLVWFQEFYLEIGWDLI